jgi:hypothetical protein
VLYRSSDPRARARLRQCIADGHDVVRNEASHRPQRHGTLDCIIREVTAKDEPEWLLPLALDSREQVSHNRHVGPLGVRTHVDNVRGTPLDWNIKMSQQAKQLLRLVE